MCACRCVCVRVGVCVCVKHTAVSIYCLENISLGFSRNSEANAYEFLENLKEMF